MIKWVVGTFVAVAVAWQVASPDGVAAQETQGSSSASSALRVEVIDDRLWPAGPDRNADDLGATIVRAQEGPRRQRHLLIGALIGAGVGTGLGLALDKGCEGGDCPPGNYVIVISAGLGALLGALIGVGSAGPPPT